MYGGAVEGEDGAVGASLEAVGVLGEQQQRVAVARAVVAEPKIILADEPTGNLDSKHGDEVMEMLTELNDHGTTIVMVTHSPSYAEFSHRIIHLFDGQVVSENFTLSQHAYA